MADVADAAPSAVADRYGTGRARRLDRRLGWTVATLAVLGGLLFLVGMFVMAWNVYKTLQSDEQPVPAPAPQAA